MPLTVLMNYPHIFLRKENEQAAGRLPGWYGFSALKAPHIHIQFVFEFCYAEDVCQNMHHQVRLMSNECLAKL